MPLEDVVFDTFDGGFARLSDAAPPLIRDLRDRIAPVYAPVYGGPDSLPWLRDDDIVLGYATETAAYAFPLKILNVRELVNDVIDGVPLLVSYCPLCATGAVYSRRLDGRTLLFGNTSALYQSDLVMYDHQTGSYWFQAGGEALVGPLTGKRLPLLPSTTDTWGEWKRLHPDTRLLTADADEPFDARFARDPFAGYGAQVDQERFAFPVDRAKLDRRLRAGEIVTTVEAGGKAKAYATRLLGDAAVNDEVGGVPVVVLSRAVGFGSGFVARAGGRRLTFAFDNGAVVDRETQSTWDLAGRATSGPLVGTRLQSLPVRRGYWFAIAIAEPGIPVVARLP